jgi:hypothetical protein
MAASSSPAETMPSSHQWLPVATTAHTVSTGWASTSQRHRLPLIPITATAMSSAQATWTEGIAASWFEMPEPPVPYTDWR